MVDLPQDSSGELTAAAGSSAALEAAWRHFYGQYFDTVYRFVCRCGTPMSDVEDMVQRTFLVAHRKLRHPDELEKPAAWLRATALRVVSENRRKRRFREVKHRLFRMKEDVEEAPQRSPEQLSEAARAQQVVGEVLSRIPKKLRDVLILTDLEQCKPGEVAEILGIPVNTVRSRRRLAREQFKKHWRRIGAPGGGDG